MRKFLAVSVGLIAIGLGVWATARTPSGDSTSPPDEQLGPPAPSVRSEDAEVEVRDDLTPLRREIAHLKGRLSSVETDTEEFREKSDVDRSIDLTDPDSRQEALRVASLRRVNRFQEVMSHEIRDNAWAPETERDVYDSVEALAFDDGRVQQVSCRTTVCEIWFEHETWSNRRDFFHGLMDVEPFLHGGHIHLYEPTGNRATSVMYIMREGNDLPDFSDSEP